MKGASALVADWIAKRFPELADVRPLGDGLAGGVIAGTHAEFGRVVLRLQRPSPRLLHVVHLLQLVTASGRSGIPRVFAAGREPTPFGECLWSWERFVSGVGLADELRSGPLTSAELLRLAQELLTALERIERVGLVHADIKPSNLLRCERGRYWLVDFGSARPTRGVDFACVVPGLTELSMGKTWGYAAPEQCRNQLERVDGRADLFALGVTLHECASGQNFLLAPPCDAREIHRRIEVEGTPALTLGVAWGAGFSKWLGYLTRPAPEDRPARSRDARRALRRALRDAQALRGLNE
jgi:serine/threonine-protein kinase